MQIGKPEKFTLVVPTLNEEASIKTLLDRASSALCESPVQWEILVIDDESTDATADVVEHYGQSESRVRLISRRGQHGLAGAIVYGWNHSDADLVGVIDADLQHPPELLPRLITEVCNGCDLAIASRYLQPHSMDDWSPVRRAISRLGLLASVPVQKPTLRVKDSMSGFFVLRRKCISGLTFQTTGFKLLLEILAKGHIRSVVEVPFRFKPRTLGKSKANAMTAVHYLSLLYRLCFKRETHSKAQTDEGNDKSRGHSGDDNERN